MTMHDGFAIESTIRGHKIRIDQPVSVRGTDTGPTPLEYLFVSLGGCVCTIGRIIAIQRKLPIRSIRARVEGTLDTDVLKGKSTESRAGFESIRVITEIDADLTLEEKRELLEEIDRRCPISDNLHFPTPISVVLEEDVAEDVEIG